jgi:hypothetical protein
VESIAATLHGAAILRHCVGLGHHDHPAGLRATMRGGQPCSREGGQTKDKAGGAWDRRKQAGKGEAASQARAGLNTPPAEGS